jgi:hypothetical protein
MSQQDSRVVENRLTTEASDAARQIELGCFSGFDIVDDWHCLGFSASRPEDAIAVWHEGFRALFEFAVFEPGHLVRLEMIDAEPAEVCRVVRNEESLPVRAPVGGRSLCTSVSNVEVSGRRPVGISDVDILIVEVVTLVSGVRDAVTRW